MRGRLVHDFHMQTTTELTRKVRLGLGVFHRGGCLVVCNGAFFVADDELLGLTHAPTVQDDEAEKLALNRRIVDSEYLTSMTFGYIFCDQGFFCLISLIRFPLIYSPSDKPRSVRELTDD